MTTDRLHLVRIHLDDHRAGAAGGAALARRMADEWADRAEYESLVHIADAIDEDVDMLDRIRDTVGASGGGVKRMLALIGERLGRLKPNGNLVRHSPLSLVQELEQLAAGVLAKRLLWAALRSAVDAGTELGVDLAELERRADSQLEAVRDLHAAASAAAFDAP